MKLHLRVTGCQLTVWDHTVLPSTTNPQTSCGFVVDILYKNPQQIEVTKFALKYWIIADCAMIGLHVESGIRVPQRCTMGTNEAGGTFQSYTQRSRLLAIVH